MKIILDTNVFISGIYFSGPPSRILEKWQDKSFQIILSEQILLLKLSEYKGIKILRPREFAEQYL